MQPIIKIALAEDNSALAKSIQEKLSFFSNLEFVFSAKNGRDLLKKLEKEHDVDVILMDINMPVMNGIEATKELKANYPNIKVIMSTVFDEDEYIFQAILAGANGYLLKDERAEKINFSIQEVIEGGAPMSVSIATRTLELLRQTNAQPASENIVNFNLTKRELEILELLSEGQNYNQIADISFISPSTVRKHIENIYQKLQVHSKVEAVQLAIKHRLI